MNREQKINRVLAGLSHTGYTTEIEKCEARLLIEELKEENEKLNHYKLLYQKVKERNDKAIEYVNFLAIGTQGIKEELLDKCQIGMVKFNKTIWGEELLEILKGNNEE